MRGYELTDRGKIVIAGLVVLLLLVLSVVLMVKAIANQAPPVPDNQEATSYGTPSLKPTDILPEITDSPPPFGGDFTQQGVTPTNGGDATPPDATSPNSSNPTTPGATTPNGGDATTPGATSPNSSNPTPPGATSPNGNSSDPPNTPVPTASETSGTITLPNGQDNSLNHGEVAANGNTSNGSLSFSFSPNNQERLDTGTISELAEFLKSPDNTKNSTIAVETQELSGSSRDKLMAAVTIALAEYGVPKERVAYVLRRSGVARETFEVMMYFIPASEK